ncbi:MAG: hypothetical protein WDM77_13305 [Steroidobacteraceae bacterium]
MLLGSGNLIGGLLLSLRILLILISPPADHTNCCANRGALARVSRNGTNGRAAGGTAGGTFDASTGLFRGRSSNYLDMRRVNAGGTLGGPVAGAFVLKLLLLGLIILREYEQANALGGTRHALHRLRCGLPHCHGCRAQRGHRQDNGCWIGYFHTSCSSTGKSIAGVYFRILLMQYAQGRMDFLCRQSLLAGPAPGRGRCQGHHRGGLMW